MGTSISVQSLHLHPRMWPSSPQLKCCAQSIRYFNREDKNKPKFFSHSILPFNSILQSVGISLFFNDYKFNNQSKAFRQLWISNNYKSTNLRKLRDHPLEVEIMDIQQLSLWIHLTIQKNSHDKHTYIFKFTLESALRSLGWDDRYNYNTRYRTRMKFTRNERVKKKVPALL